MTISTATILLLIVPANTVLHEAAHALTARLAGRQVAAISLGVGPRLIDSHHHGTRLTIRAIPLAGRVSWHSDGSSRAVRVCVALAGPVATLAFGLTIVATAGASAPGVKYLISLGLLTLVPGLPGADGTHAWKALRQPTAPPAT